MLQRIQTIWLFLAAICVFLTLKFSTYSGTNKEMVSPYFLKGTENLMLMFVTIAAGIIPLVAVFLYTQRKLQLRMAILAILLQTGLIYLYYREVETFIGKGAISLTAALHVLALLFLVLAVKGISADEKLIKDSNRLR